MISRVIPAALATSLYCLSVAELGATPYPDSGTIFREFKDGSFREFAPRPEPIITKPKSAEREYAGTQIHITGYEVHGNTQLDAESVKHVLNPYTGRTLTDKELHQGADALAALYHDNGFFAAKVIIPPQSISNGVVVLHVYEGRFDTVSFELVNSGKRVNQDTLNAILDHNIKAGEVIRTRDVEKAILLIEDTPGVHSSTVLYPGSETGTAKLHVETVDEDMVSGNIDIDNFGGYYTGEYRLGGTVYLNSPARAGDQLTARFVTSGQDSNYGYLRYTIPVSGSGTRIGASADYLDYNLGEEYRALGSEGNAFEFRAFMTQPAVRTRHTNFNWGLDLAQLKLDDHDDQGELAQRTIRTGVIRLNGDHDDDLFAAGTTYYSIDLTYGDVSIDGNQAYIDFDTQNTQTAGSFGKANFSLSRLQHLKGKLSSFISVSGQYANKNLDSSQKFYIGGPFSVPGYPTGEAAGDDALLLHLDLRHDYYTQPWGGVLQASVFYTYGWTALFKETWPGWEGANPTITQDISLQSAGFGLYQNWPSGIVIRAMIGWQIGENNGSDPVTGADSDQSTSDYRGWLQGIYYF